MAATSLAITVLGALLLVTWNVGRLLAEWTSATELSVYLRDDATSGQRGALEALIDASGVAGGREGSSMLSRKPSWMVSAESANAGMAINGTANSALKESARVAYSGMKLSGILCLHS